MSATMPSRDFLVRQSVLNAANRYRHLGPIRKTLRRVYLSEGVSWNLYQQICKEFRALTSRYGVSP